MKTTGFKYPFRMIALAAAILSVLLLVLHLLLPYMINTRKMRESIAAKGAKAFSAQIDFREIKPSIFPRPRVMVENFSLAKANRAEIHIPKMVIYPELWPLFGGDLRIKRFEMVQPLVVLHNLPPALPRPDFVDRDPTRTVKETTTQILAAIDDLLGNIEAKIADGHLVIRSNGRMLADFSQFNSRITSSSNQFDLNISCIAKRAGKINLEATVDRHTLNGNGHITLDGFEAHLLNAIGLMPPLDHLPGLAVDLNLEFDTQGMQRYIVRFAAGAPAVRLAHGGGRLTIEDVSISGQTLWDPQKLDVTISKFQAASPPMRWSGSALWSKKPPSSERPIRISMQGSGLEIAAIRSAALQLWSDNLVVQRVFDIVQGGKIPEWSANLSATAWNNLAMDHLRADCRLSEGRIHIPNDLFKLEQVSGRVSIANGALNAHTVTARYGNTSATNGTLSLGLYDGSRAFTLDTLIDADPVQLPGTLKRLIKSQKALARLDAMPTFGGRMKGRLILGERWDSITARTEGSAQLSSEDTQLNITGSVIGLASAKPSAHIWVKGRMGSKTALWLSRLAGVPADQSINTPMNITGAEITLGPRGQLGLDGAFDWKGGPHAKATLSLTGSDFNLKQLHIKDGVSDAQISYRRRKAGRVVDAGFKGVVHGSTIEKMIPRSQYLSGWLRGRLKAHIDRRAIHKSTMAGKLSARGLTFPFQGPMEPIQVLRASFSGRGKTFEIPAARLTWNDSTISLTGGGTFNRQAVDLIANIQADKWDAYQFVSKREKDPASTPNSPSNGRDFAIPIRTRVSAAIGQLTYDRYRFSPMQATIEYDGRKTLMTITEADLCGVQFPGSIELSGGTSRMEFHPKASRSTLKDTGSCLLDSQHTEKLEGTVDLNGKLTTHGQNRDEFLTHLKGRMILNIDQGRIYNVGSAGLFTNLLSYLSVNQYIKGGLPDLSQDVFNYDRLDTQWVFDGGYVFIKEGVLKSNSVNMVADGRYHLLSKDIDLVVLVSPLTTVDWIVERIPILGNILQGTLVAIPVSIKGPESDPKVLPMAPSAVGARLGGILKRTLKTPVRIIEPLINDGSTKEGPQK